MKTGLIEETGRFSRARNYKILIEDFKKTCRLLKEAIQTFAKLIRWNFQRALAHRSQNFPKPWNDFGIKKKKKKRQTGRMKLVSQLSSWAIQNSWGERSSGVSAKGWISPASESRPSSHPYPYPSKQAAYSRGLVSLDDRYSYLLEPSVVASKQWQRLFKEPIVMLY